MAGEKNFENKIKKFLKDRGCWYVKYFANRNTRAGVPDILACVNSRFVAIEVKAENGKPTELQKWNVEQRLTRCLNASEPFKNRNVQAVLVEV